MSSENFKSMANGPKYNIRRYPNPNYNAFLQNKEFTEFLAANFNSSIERIAEAVEAFKIQMPDVEFPELDTSSLEEGLEAVNHNIILLLEEQRATNDYIKELIGVMQHVAGVKKPKP